MSKIFEALRNAQVAAAKTQELLAASAAVEQTKQRTSGKPASSRSASAAAKGSAQQAVDERRVQKRSQRRVPVLVRPSDPEQDDHFEEILTTRNTSRSGLYVAMGRHTYREGMRLFVTFPYMPSAPGIGNEYIAQIVRMDPSSESPDGLAVQLLGSMNVATA